jgi:OOP family OmpA-OmpF porin
MRDVYLKKTAMAFTLMLFTIASSGCATKKFVRARVDPLDRRVTDLESKTKEHTDDIDELQKGVSRASEQAATADQKAVAADQKAVTADQKAETADQKAAQAGQQASAAKSFAQQGLSNMDRRVDALNHYQLAFNDSVLFAFNSSKLTDEAKAQLDQAASRLTPEQPFVIEIQGFTDKTGPANYNLTLSRNRANAVVRYLTLEHKIPLYRIHVLGLGSEAPVADNSTRDGRKLNRRVEIRLFTAGEKTEAAKLNE